MQYTVLGVDLHDGVYRHHLGYCISDRFTKKDNTSRFTSSRRSCGSTSLKLSPSGDLRASSTLTQWVVFTTPSY